MSLDGSFDVSMSVMNRRNIARLSKQRFSFSDCCSCSLVLARTLFSSLQREAFCCFVSAWVLFSSLRREVVSFDLSSLKRERVDFVRSIVQVACTVMYIATYIC